MDFRQTTQPSGNRPAAAPAPVTPERKEEKNPAKFNKSRTGWLNILTMILLVGVVVLLVGIILAFTRSSSDNESKFVVSGSGKYQAVFLNNGQVYFGNIQEMNSSYVRMTNIYYLTQNGSTNSTNYSLVKLGCQQIHDPLDEMVINRSQVTFWENLNSNGKVVTSIKQFQQQNPNGPNCAQVSSQTQASSSNTQGSSSTDSTGSSSTSSK